MSLDGVVRSSKLLIDIFSNDCSVVIIFNINI